MSLADILLIVAAAYFGGVALVMTLALSLLVAFDKLRPDELFEQHPAPETAAPS